MKRIEQKVREIVNESGTSDPVNICEKMGIIILDQELPVSVNGFTVSMKGIQFIVLNSSLDYYERRFTMAHELGHIILHGSTNTVGLSLNTEFCVSRFEREADCFAAYLLMSHEISELEALETVTTDDISRITHIPRERIDGALGI